MTAAPVLAAPVLAERFGVSEDAVHALRAALRRGGGRQAQFDHPDLGGMGQWSAGGMTQVGDMFNGALRDKVAALCTALAAEADARPPVPRGSDDAWWPAELGRPAGSGGQNGTRYAYFPQARRVAVLKGGAVTVFDSGDHRIAGVSQAQGGTAELSFASQNGTVRLSDLPLAG